jgi:TIR domain-containing protein
MAKLYISYSKKDSDEVQKIISRVESEVTHKILIDERFLDIGYPIAHEIQKKIKESDWVVVFLSSNSVNNEWVNMEIYETLYSELSTKKLKLIPCILDECKMPEAFSKQYNRVLLNFSDNIDQNVNKLNQIINKKNDVVMFENENYLLLNIPIPKLNIYMTGEIWDWQKNSQLRYLEMINSYLLFGFTIVPLTFFKHFVICEHEDATLVKDQITNSGYYVPGFGDIDPETGKRRIWFSIRDYPILGRSNNNQWPASNYPTLEPTKTWPEPQR